ncbi:MAG: hypothetical protein A3F47_00810 [Candidatus Staskawiczbacteria bacterium RIFCSPHIGHO2_12_FULL_38_11]|uniref:Phage holin family protein n=1 Tax=Candidatus Staskawiczbacteria bacterium RIFCSPHIGHO2_12_FULL_38_11 TaxID=1802209 RepID=A0A1G2I7Q8_9BACT|nr:MAG: hypothetical protein A3F47_00810 [Candidatus Staskawiczbacteria bacterium RIFCSPHIGHO2_12_FULL_38_11]
MRKLLFSIIAATAGLWLASLYVPEVKVAVLSDSNFFGFSVNQNWEIILLLGIILGLLNFFIKPLLDILTLPLRIITLGFFGFLVNASLLWVVDIMFKEFSAPWFWPLLWTTLIVWGISAILSLFNNKN